MTSIEQINALPYDGKVYHDIFLNGIKMQLVKWKYLGFSKIEIFKENERENIIHVDSHNSTIHIMEVFKTDCGFNLFGKIYHSDITLLTTNNQ